MGVSLLTPAESGQGFGELAKHMESSTLDSPKEHCSSCELREMLYAQTAQFGPFVVATSKHEVASK